MESGWDRGLQRRREAGHHVAASLDRGSLDMVHERDGFDRCRVTWRRHDVEGDRGTLSGKGVLTFHLTREEKQVTFEQESLRQ